uniref:uracil phosphoribosyltransferase n=1 Tax=Lactobacillus jensenii TaxID=109790 RepID=UPI00286FB9BD
YFFKMPEDIEERDVIIVYPMLATGGSANIAIEALKKRCAKNIRLAVLVASPEGVKNIQEDHPDLDIYAAAEDEKLMD